MTELHETIPGGRVRAGHRASLFGILGSALMIPIHSVGRDFLMVGHFPYRQVLPYLCTYTKKEPGKVPAQSWFSFWASRINAGEAEITPRIQIAETADRLTHRAYMALIGGTNHEGFHRKYTGQGQVTAEDLSHCVLPAFRPDVPYHEHLDLMGQAQNVFEDTRIERLGCAEFPGVYAKMANLADFILDEESPSRMKDLTDPKSVSPSRVVLSVLRELGLGYNTAKTREAMVHYRAVCPEAVELVTHGELSALLRESIPDVSSPKAISDAKNQVALSTTLALQFINILHDLALVKAPPAHEVKSLTMKLQEGGGSPEGVAAQVLNSKGEGMLDYASALAAIVNADDLREDAKTRWGEMPYRPYTTVNDRVRLVGGDEEISKKMISLLTVDTRKETSYLRARLRTMFRALESGGRTYGVPRGRVLSERHLVDTFVSAMAGRDPRRAFVEEAEVIDVSIAAEIVVDQSFSMLGKRNQTLAIVYTIAEALESIDAKVAISGFRALPYAPGYLHVEAPEDEDLYHRKIGVMYDVFKTYEERFKSVSWRLNHIQAEGSTPMADGIEFAVRGISERKEGHRMIFVVTDGRPDDNHGPVVVGQIRRAKEAGVHLIGIGLGDEDPKLDDASYVQDMFPDHVYAKTLEQIPVLLVEKLTELVRTNMGGASKRGRSISAQ